MNKDWAVPGRDDSLLLDPELPLTEGKQVELERLLRQHNDALVTYIYRYVRSRADANDIVQEAYCRIFRLDDPSVVSHLRGYLYRTAKNIATDWIRRRIVRDAFLREQPLRAVTESPSPEDVWIAREQLEVLERGVQSLPPKAKMALLLIREEGLSYEEVAARLGIQTHSARRLVERAMEFLVDALDRESRTVSVGGKQ